MDGELGSLASSAATTIVNLLATDAWGQVKEKIGVLFRRFRPDQAHAAEAELDRGHLEIQTADAMVALAITRDWESRLLRLLAADAAVAGELSRVVAELKQIPVGPHVRGAVWQSANASGQSTVIQVGGDAAIGGLPLIPHARPADQPPGGEQASMRSEVSDQAQAYQAGHDQFIGHLHLDGLGQLRNRGVSGSLPRGARIDLRRDWGLLAVAGTSIGTLVMLFMPWVSVSSGGVVVTGGVFAQGLTPPFAVMAILAVTGTLIATGACMNSAHPGTGGPGLEGASFLVSGWIDLLLAVAAFGLAITGLVVQRRILAGAGDRSPSRA